MRFVVVCLLFLTTADTQTFGEWSGLDRLLGRPPTGADVLLEFHQFDLFEGAVYAGTADQRATPLLENFQGQNRTRRKRSRRSLDEAEQRSRPQCQIYRRAELDRERPSRWSPRLRRRGACPKMPTKMRSRSTESTISLLQRYIAKPDNEDVKTFAMTLIPALRTGLATVRTGFSR